MNDDYNGPADARPGGGASPPGVSSFGARLRRAYHQVFGVPDYAAYVEHMKTAHPDGTPMSEREFFECAIERKYSRKGPRCC